MLEFAWPWAFALLPLPLLAWWLLPPYRERRASVQIPFFARVAEATGQKPQPGAVILRRLPLQMIVAVIIWLLMVSSLARPQRVGDPITHEIAARDMMLAIDISGSMSQPDFKAPDQKMLQRLDGVKQVVRDFIARRKGVRIGLILFGTRAFVQAPFTQDLQTVQMLLDQTAVAMAGEQTAIGDAIGLAIKTFDTSKTKQRMLILLTDGNDTASRVPSVHAAEIAQQRGLTIYTIGVGDTEASGENRVDLPALREVASTTGGRFFRAENGEQLEAIYADIDKLAPVKLQTESWRPKLPLFQWPLGAAVVLGLGLWTVLLLRGLTFGAPGDVGARTGRRRARRADVAAGVAALCRGQSANDDCAGCLCIDGAVRRSSDAAGARQAEDPRHACRARQRPHRPHRLRRQRASRHAADR
jgi:Ca-activated chloride channel family protein